MNRYIRRTELRRSTVGALALWCTSVLLSASCDGEIAGAAASGSRPVKPAEPVEASATPDAEATTEDARTQGEPSKGDSGTSGGAKAGTSGGTSSAADAGQAGATGSTSDAGSDGPAADAEAAAATDAGPAAVDPRASYTVTGSWLARPIAIEQKPGKLVFTKLKVDDRFLAESCSIGDYNRDGTPDISAGRRWYEGPFSPSGAAKEHIFRQGHDELPRTGKTLDELDTGVSDDWSCFAEDVDADGYTDIINIACPDMDDEQTPDVATRQHSGTAVWYRNPGPTVSTTTEMWQAYPMSDDVRGEQHGLADLNGDGMPEIYGACKSCGDTARTDTITRGFFQVDTEKPTSEWTYHAVTTPYPWPGGGWLHGFGFGDVNLDGKIDLLERAGIWTNVLSEGADTDAYYEVRLYGEGDDPKYGGSNMYAADFDGDADMDIVSSDKAHAYGISWYEQTSPGQFTKHQFVGAPDEGFAVSFSQAHAMEVVDMDGDGVSDVVTGKTYLAHPEGTDDPDPDLRGEPVNYVFKAKRDAGTVTFEPHLIDTSDAKVGIGRQIAVGHVDTDGIMDVCIASKLGVYVFLGQ